jgi:hypothetical protein
VDENAPVTEVIKPIFTVSLVMPGALAAFLARSPHAELDAPVPGGAVVPVAAVFLLLLHAVISKTPTAMSADSLNSPGPLNTMSPS